MKKVAISLLSLFLLNACDSEQSTATSYDVECLGKDNGWHENKQIINDTQENSYSFDGQWHCQNEKLWYASATDKLNLFGQFYVTKTDSADITTKYRYDFIQINKAQNLVIQLDGTNKDHNREVQSFDMTFEFLTTNGVLAQLFKMDPYSSNAYFMEYSANSGNIKLLQKTIFKGHSDSLYQRGTSECSSTNNQEWHCNHWDSYYDNDQNEESRIAGESTSKDQSLTPDLTLLINPLKIRDELSRLSDNLFN